MLTGMAFIYLILIKAELPCLALYWLQNVMRPGGWKDSVILTTFQKIIAIPN